MSMAPISIYYQNVRGLRSKTSDFLRNVRINSYDIICITESWLNESVFNSELFDDRYIVFRNDRNFQKTKQGKGGGVLIAINRELSAESRCEWLSSAEDIWVTLTLRNRHLKSTYKLHICVVYICDEKFGNSLQTQLNNFVENLINIVIDHPLDKFIVLGDFNMPHVTWSLSDDGISLSPSNLHGSQVDILDSMYTCSLLQYNQCFNASCNRILDLVFSNSDVVVAYCQPPLAPLVPEDPHHPALIISAEFVQLHTIKPISYIKYLYHNGVFESFIYELDSIDWYDKLNTCTLEDAVAFVYNTLYRLRERFIPSKTIVPSTKYPVWY